MIITLFASHLDGINLLFGSGAALSGVTITLLVYQST